MPTGYAVGDKLVALVHWHNSLGTTPSCSDGTWSFVGVKWGSSGSYGLDAGPRGVAVWEKVATSTSEAAPTFTQPAGAGGAGFGALVLYATKSLGAWAATTFASGEDTTSGTGYSATAGSDPGITTGDLVILASSLSDDTASFSAGPTLTWTGATLAALTVITATANTQGNDMRVTSQRAAVTAGTSSAAPVLAGTLAVAAIGVSAFLRLRDQANVVTRAETGAVSISGSAAVVEVEVAAPSGAVSISGSAAVVEVEVAAPSGAVSISGSAAVVEVEVAAPSGTVTISGSAVTREVEIVAPSGAVTISGSAVVREVRVIAESGAVSISGSAVVREVRVIAESGAVSIGGSAAVLSGELSGATITVTIGSWTQDWELGTELDEAALDMISAEGCILDNLTASWSAETIWDQPDPTVVSFRVYVPAGAAGPQLDQGAIASVLVEPRGGSDATYLPLLELTGAVSDGSATPLRDGLAFDVVVTDFLADLGEQMVGNVVWQHGTRYQDDYASPDGSYFYERVRRLQRAMAADGQTLDYDVTDYDDLLLPGALLTINPMDGWMGPNLLGPAFADTDGSPRPTNEVVEETLREGTKWGPEWRPLITTPGYGHIEDRYAGYATYDRRVVRPLFRDWPDLSARPVAFARAERGDFGVHWVSQRIEGNAGLPLQLVLGDDGKLTTRAKALDSDLPDSSRYGAWLPAGAVTRDSVSWTVNKDAHPRTARATGWFRAIVPYGDGGNLGGEEGVEFISASDWVVGYSYASDQGTRPVEAQVDLPEISGPTDSNALDLAIPQALLWAKVGWLYDAQPLYELGSLEIRYAAIGDPRAWPRLFQQPDQDMNAPDYDWFAGALGRFLFLYDIPAKWHPYGLDHWWGFLTGATLTIAGGKITATAQLAHRMPGPSGPRGEPVEIDGSDRWRLLTPDTPGAITWTEWEAEFPSLTWEDLDPTLTWASMAMATT
jgi:hypothetical protein